jgi:hypothetical protein
VPAPLSPVTTPEFELLLRTLRHDRAPASAPIQAPIDWSAFLDLCRAHAVRPLAHRYFTAVKAEEVPQPALSALDRFMAAHARRNAILALELTRLLSALEKRGVQAATFKGPVLAQHVYGSLSLREFLDIDLIVRPRDFPEAARLLRDEGYQSAAENSPYVAENGQLAFYRPGAGFAVDLHSKLAPFGLAFPFSDNELWAGLQTLPVSGFEVKTLSWDHLALFLAFHGSKERWRSLKWVCDFAFLAARRPELDGKQLLRQARRNHCSRDLLVAARLTQALGFGAPPDLLVPDPPAGAQARRTLRALVHPQPESELSVFIYSLRGQERLRDKLRLAARLLTTLTESDFRAVRLPARLRWLHYPIRPLRIAGKAFGQAIERLRPVTSPPDTSRPHPPARASAPPRTPPSGHSPAPKTSAAAQPSGTPARSSDADPR